MAAQKDPSFTGSAGSPPRLMSVDALRGFDMFWIVGGDCLVRSLPAIRDSAFTRAFAAQMEHCEWAGFHHHSIAVRVAAQGQPGNTPTRMSALRRIPRNA